MVSVGATSLRCVAPRELVITRTFVDIPTASLHERALEGRRDRAFTDGSLELALGYLAAGDAGDASCEGQCHSDDSTACDSPRRASEATTPDLSPRARLAASWGDSDSESSEVCEEEAIELTDSSESDSEAREAEPIEAALPPNARTTLVFKNLPQGAAREDLCSLLDEEGFQGRYDFVYAPTVVKTMTPYGYAFVQSAGPTEGLVNFAKHETAILAMLQLDGLPWTVGAATSELQVEWSSRCQGLQALVARCCPVVHASISDSRKPTLLQGGGPVPVPMPTKARSAPREFRSRGKAARKASSAHRQFCSRGKDARKA